MDPFLRRWEFNNVTGDAAARGDLKTIKWLMESHFPDEFLTEVVADAADNGHLHVLEWLWENHRSQAYWGGIELCYAMESKYHEVVQWLRTHVGIRPELASNLIRLAAAEGDIELVRTVYEKFDVEIVTAFKAAKEGGRWEVVLWILNNAKRDDLNATFNYDDYVRLAKLGIVEGYLRPWISARA